MPTREEAIRADLERIALRQGKTRAQAATEAERLAAEQISRERAARVIAKQRARVEAAERVAPPPVTPPGEMVTVEAESRKVFGARVEAPPLPVVTRAGEKVPARQLTPFTPVRMLTPQQIEAGAIPTVFERAATGDISQAELERQIAEARGEVRTREFFEAGGQERLAELHAAAEKEAKEAEQAAEKLRQLGIPFVDGEEPESLTLARERLERAFEGVDVTVPVSRVKFAEITAAQETFAEEFGKHFKIGPELLESRIARAEGEGLFEAFTKETQEAIAAQAELAAFGGEFLRGPTETEREFFLRIRPTVEVTKIDPDIQKFLGVVAVPAGTVEPTLARAFGVREITDSATAARIEFLAGVKVGIHPPELTFAGKVFKATVEAEAKLEADPFTRGLGPAAAALGGIGARIIGGIEETGRFLDELFGLKPRRPVIPPPTFISPFLGGSPLEALVHPGRRFISGLAAGAVFLPLETKAFSAVLKPAAGWIKGATRGLGEDFIFRLSKSGILKTTKLSIKRLPFGEKGAVVGRRAIRIKPIEIGLRVEKVRGPGIVAERIVKELERFQIAHSKLTSPLRPFFGKPRVVELSEARKLLLETAGRVSRGGPKITERVRIIFGKTGERISAREFAKIQKFLRSLDPETAVIKGVKRARGVVGGVEVQFKGLAQRPAQNVLRLLGGEKGILKTIEIGEVATKRTTSQLLRQMQFGFKEPGVRGRLARFFRPTEQRRFFRRVLGERGADIGEVRPRAPIGVKRVTIPRLEPTLEAAPEIVERTAFRRFLETIGIQRPAPGEVRGVAIMERLRISAQPSAKLEKAFKVFPAKKVGVMKPFDLGVPEALDVRPVGVPSGVPPTETGVGGLRSLLDVPGRIAERGRLSLRLIAGIPVKTKPFIGPRLASALRLGTAVTGVTALRQRVRPVEKPIVVSREVAEVRERIKAEEKPFMVTRPIESQLAAQEQGLRVKQAVQQSLKSVQVQKVVGIDTLGGEFDIPFKRFVLPGFEEEDMKFDVKPIKVRRIVRKVRTARVVSVEKLFDVPTFKPHRVGSARARPMKIKIPEIKLPFSEG